MRVYYLQILLLIFSNFLVAEKMWVFFQDKDVSAQDYAPITEKSMERREKMHLNLTWYDLKLNQDYIDHVLAIGVILHHRSRWLNAISVSGTGTQLAAVRSLPCVTRVQPVLRYKRDNTHLPPQLQPDQLLVDSSMYGFSWEQISQINVHTAHAAGYYGQGVRVLILDTGFFRDLTVFDSLVIIDEYDFINDDSNTANETNDASDQHNHGTAVFSILAGYDPGNFIGPAYRSEFLLAKTEDVTSESIIEEDNYVAALEWGEQNGADVASSSLGYLDWYSYCDMDGNTAITTIAVDIAVSLGVVCVTSAGNWGTAAPPPDPCDTLYYYISAPADADSVISIGAVNSNGDIASFSSRGPTFDGRIKPEVCARGVSTWCVDINDDSYSLTSGTSASAPLVSGAAAMILSAHPEWTPMEVREALMMTADRADNPDNEYGYGVIDVMAAINYDISNAVHDEQPSQYSMIHIYPNPFNITTTIQMMGATGSITSLKVFDINGRLVETLIDQSLAPGTHTHHWNASIHPSGVYFVSLHSGLSQSIRKITILK